MKRMFRFGPSTLVLSIVLILTGCFRSPDDSSFRVTPSNQPPAPSPTPPLASHTSAVSGETTPQIAPPTQSTPQPQHTGAEQPPAVAQHLPPSKDVSGLGPRSFPATTQRVGGDFPVQLSAAVALPMTGPEGTMMGFSVEYQFRGTSPPHESCFWYIEGASGKQYRLAVKLDLRGNLMLVVPGWRPEDGPFRCRIEDQSGRPLSLTVEMH